MSQGDETNLTLEENQENEVHFVYGDQEYVMGGNEITSELGDLICPDGSRAILVDGQYLVADNQGFVLQDSDNNLTQFYVNENSEGFVVDEQANNLTEFVQFVEEDTSEETPQIIYYTNEETNDFQTITELASQNEIESVQDEEGNIYPCKRIRLEGQMLNFNEFVQEQEVNLEGTDETADKVEYAVLESNGYQLCSLNNPESGGASNSNPSSESNDISTTQIVDLSKITGRNLITGQTVTLHSYMQKLQKKLEAGSGRKPTSTNNNRQSGSDSELNSLLDKKIAIGKTKSGKNIVGRIIHIGRKSDLEGNLVINENSEEAVIPIENKEKEPNFIFKHLTPSPESCEQISKTLSGVMEMESVRKKLEFKNIVVKLIEKNYVSESDAFIKTTSYCCGVMTKYQSEEGGEIVDKWRFVPDDEKGESNDRKFPITTSLTIAISHGKCGKKTVRVNLNPANGNVCIICGHQSKTNLQLRQHMDSVHNTYGNQTTCEICDKSFENVESLQEHKLEHVSEGQLFNCQECKKFFTSQNKLNRHLTIHDLYLRPLECSVCEVRCSSEWALKKHLLTHTGIKPFTCDICNKQFLTQYDVTFHKKIHFPEKHFACNICLRTFSRHSNLLRHMEIHKGSGYKCEICCCTFNYISSLTRHMVQNHIDAGDLGSTSRRTEKKST